MKQKEKILSLAQDVAILKYEIEKKRKIMNSKFKYNVSVIVPCYKVEKYISRCIDSLLNQTLKNIEIICVNDGSPDNTLEILKKYKEKFGENFSIIDKKMKEFGKLE